jgi:hypothetical protein
MQDLDEMKLARVIDACGGVDGRVKLQKTVYLLTAMGYELPFDDFRIRRHGPYSRAVACSTDTLKGAGFVEEQVEELPFANDFDEPAQQFSHNVRDSIRPLLRQHFDVPAPPGKPPLDTVAAALRANDRTPLEVAATKLFLQRQERLAGPKLDEELRRLKRHLSAHFATADVLIAEWARKSWL